VPFDTTAHKVRKVFDEAAPFYDRMNDWMSLGLHHAWKDALVTSLPWSDLRKKPHALTFLDMAGGTGDITKRLAERCQDLHRAPKLLLADINTAMLEVSQKRHPEAPWAHLHEDATRLSLKTSTVDVYTIAFGLRNVSNLKHALQETFRVLKPGGSFHCLEFSAPRTPIMHTLFRLYLHTWIPLCAVSIADRVSPYTYLRKSILAFPQPCLLAQMMEKVGFEHVTHRPLSGGVVALHTAIKPLKTRRT